MIKDCYHDDDITGINNDYQYTIIIFNFQYLYIILIFVTRDVKINHLENNVFFDAYNRYR